MKLQFEITRQDYLDFTIHNFIKTRLLTHVIAGIFGFLILLLIIIKDQRTVRLVPILSAFLFYIVVYFLFVYYSLINAKSIPKKDGSYLGNKEFDFGDDFISGKDKNSSSQFQWNAINTVEEGRRAFYLYLDANMAIAIPKRCFADKTEEQQFIGFVKSKLISKSLLS